MKNQGVQYKLVKEQVTDEEGNPLTPSPSPDKSDMGTPERVSFKPVALFLKRVDQIRDDAEDMLNVIGSKLKDQYENELIKITHGSNPLRSSGGLAEQLFSAR